MAELSASSGHAFRVENQVRALAAVLGIGTAIALPIGLLLGSWTWVLFIGCLAGWLVLGLYYLMNRAVIEPVGDAIGRILVPAGGSTPSVAQHSNIETMEARGDHTGAAGAYRAAVLADPNDLVACEKLARLAQFQLKDAETAIWAYHQAEQRITEPRRQQGYALLALELHRGLGDTGRTIVEMRKFLARWPDAPNAAELRREIETLKQEHFGNA